ncbi:translation factor SUA5 [Gelidibacter algens]|uniref:Threonylcarbamoyl-AMP synthase n=1 Tax=Gelidibacter algens TaxID=49280 RepID=A0A1A7R6Y0_9FLAO|nr:L-threonylcarbamoyladenylate synthase [Gelidibacter algens]OBX27258.1 threonylcarbamoyl-AMP synthase [Gelidibacter algens]RAJ22126.1 translation factor SUA5 [Gelidibacter algens]
MTIISKDIAKAVEILNNQDVVAIPTETVYGLAGNMYSEKAIRKIFEIKQRPLFNPLIVHIHSIAQIDDIAREFPDKAKVLAKAFWPGPLTLVLKKKKSVPDVITAGRDTVAIRIPNHPVTLSLLKNLSFPLAAPSANPFGSISPTSAMHVEGYFKNTLSMILEGGDCKNGIESTIIGFENDEAVLYRLGSIPIEDIKHVIGEVKVKNKKESAPNAPGMLARHYAPKTKTYLVEDAEHFVKAYSDKKIGVLRFDKEMKSSNIEHVEVLSKKGDLTEAASNLYNALHKLDTLHLDMIVAEKFPDFGLGASINDRLERATKTK